MAVLRLAYKAGGVVTGWLTVSAPLTSTISGTIDWIKPQDSSDFYPQGFVIAGINTPSAAGVSKALPVQGVLLGSSPLGNLSQATLQIAGGALSQTAGPFAVTFNQGVGTSAGLTGFKILPTSGLFSGSFMDHDAPAQKRTFSGILIPGATPAGFGFFKGDSQETGAVEF